MTRSRIVTFLSMLLLGAVLVPAGPASAAPTIPTLTTVASAGGVVGTSVSDTATLAGGTTPTGTITFNLFGPNDATCAGSVAFTATVPVTGNAAHLSGGFSPTTAGTYRWIATYNGDVNNTPVSGACGDAGESVVITKATPTLSTTASAAGPVGTALTDTATVTGGQAPTGNVTFNLYGPSDATCAATPVFSDTKPLAGPTQSGGFTPTLVGTYRWVATYNGDVNNNAVSGVCGAPTETVTMTKAAPVLTTVASAGGVLGIAVTDTATLTGGQAATGTVTFNLYGPDNATCAGSPVFTNTKPLSGPTQSAAFTPTLPGTYRWTTSYSGDANNNVATGACNATNESVVITKATPVLSTTASPGGALGTAVTDAAVLTGGLTPTGTITFKLYGPNDATCGGNPVFTSVKTITGAITQSGSFTPAAPGTYRWAATYSGDASNAIVTGACNAANESVVIGKATPALTTTASAGGALGVAVSDAAVLTGGQAATGSITFRLYGPNNATCAGSPAFTSTKTISGGALTQSDAFTPTAAGTYRWTTAYSGDANNEAATGACNAPNESVVIAPAQIDLGIVKTDAADPVIAGGNISYTLTVTNAASLDATGVVATDVLPAGVSFVSTGGCSLASGIVTCDFGTLAHGASESATVVVRANGSGTVTNTATVVGNEADPNPTNNSDSEQTVVNAPLPRCDGRVATIVGTGHGDTIVGTSGADVIVGTSGRDSISGQGGRDAVCGLGGNDTLRGGRGDDTLLGQGGNDALYGGPGNDILRGGPGNDSVTQRPGSALRALAW